VRSIPRSLILPNTCTHDIVHPPQTEAQANVTFRFPLYLGLVCLAVALAAFPVNAQTLQSADSRLHPKPAAPIVFEQNLGQAPVPYQFLARRDGIQTVYFADGMDLFLPGSDSAAPKLRVSWRGANSNTTISPEQPLSGYTNYLRGSNSSRWLRRIPQFGRIRYSQIYPGIDVVFYALDDRLEHDFILAPGADARQIVLHLDRPASLTPSGDLDIQLGQPRH
jgi:hypothetical protein